MSNYKFSDQSPEGKNNRKKRNTVLLAASVLAAAALLEGIRIFAGAGGAVAGGTAGAGEAASAAWAPNMSVYQVSVSVDGKESAVYSLSDTVDTKIDGYQGGFNHLVIRDGKAVFTEADCPEQICVHHKEISKSGESIICMPHNVVISITDKKNNAEIDAEV